MSNLFLLEKFIKEALLDEAKKRNEKSVKLKRKSLNIQVNTKQKAKEKRS